MMKKAGFIVLAACAIALCFGMVACGNGRVEKHEKNFEGAWELEATKASDGASATMTAEDVATLKDEGYVCTLRLDEDQTAVLDMFGEVSEGSWEAESATRGKMTIEGQDIQMELKSNRLVLDQSGYEMTFFRS